MKKFIVFMALFLLSFCISTHADARTVTYKPGFSYQTLSPEIKNRITGCSFKENQVISYDDLRYIVVKHYDYQGGIQTGELIVNKAIAKDVTEIFYSLYLMKYPVQGMKLVDYFGGDDNKSMSANNTSSFNYRNTSTSGKNLSLHALGLAIDLNPKTNPCYVVTSKKVLPANGKVYLTRSKTKCKGRYKDNILLKNDTVYKLFQSHGFSWGGNWKTVKDYQHFYKPLKKYKFITSF